MSDLKMVADRLAAAADYTDVFGKDPATTLQQITDIYRKLARVVHPDRQPSRTEAHVGGRKPGPYELSERIDQELYAEGHRIAVATTAFQLLNKYRDEAIQAHSEGRFGQPVVLATISTKNAVHVVKRQSGVDDIAALFQTETGGAASLLKVARNARDNDLVAAEAKALKTLHSSDHTLTRHYPKLLDTFMYRDDKPGARRRANVVSGEAGYSLRQIGEAFPTGVDPRHVAWMWRRLLMAVGYAHDQGVLHGAVLPAHILILPEQHGVILSDWYYSVVIASDGEETPAIKAVVDAYRPWYPEEVTNRQPPNQATDIVMAARTMIWLLGGHPTSGLLPGSVPRPMRAWFKGCLQTKQSMRPDNAAKLLAEFDDLLERIGEPYHPRRWIDFVVPPGVT